MAINEAVSYNKLIPGTTSMVNDSQLMARFVDSWWNASATIAGSAMPAARMLKNDVIGDY